MTIRGTFALILVAFAALATGCSVDSNAISAIDRGPPTAPRVERSDWPCLYGPQRDSISTETYLVTRWSAEGPPVKWRRSVGRGYSSPVIASGKLILFHRLGNEEIVECLDAAQGDPLWQSHSPTAYECPVAYSDGPYSTPTITNGRVFAWGAEGRLRSLAMNDGAEIWQRDLATDYGAKPAGFYPVAASPLVEGNVVILPVGGVEIEAGIVALDALTGKTVWRATSDPAGYASPIAATLHGRRYLFVFTAAGLVSLDPTDGRVHWSIPFAAKNAEIVNATTPVASGDIVFVSGYSLGNLCLRIRADGSYEELWRDQRRHLDSQYNNLVVQNGHVYGFATDHTLRCLNLLTGEIAWKLKSNLSRGSSIAVGNRLIVLGERGHLGALDLSPREPAEIIETKESITGGDVCFSSLALSNGLLYVRTEKELICLDLRP